MDLSIVDQSSHEYHLSEVARGIAYEVHGMDPVDVRSVLNHAGALAGANVYSDPTQTLAYMAVALGGFAMGCIVMVLL